MARRSKRSRAGRIRTLLGGDSYTLALWLIILLGVVLIATFYTGPYLRFDDARYMAFVSQISFHIFNPVASPWAYGWLFPYLVFISGSIFGMTASGMIIFTALEYLSLIGLAYLLALRVGGNRKTALLAAFLVCIFPFTIQYSTRLLDDLLMGVIASLSIVFFLSGRKLDWVFAGVMAGMLLYIKPIALAFLVPFFICALLTKKRVYIIVPMILAIVGYTIPFIILVHNPLYPFQNYGTIQGMISPNTFMNNFFGLTIMASVFQTVGNIAMDYQTYQLGLLLWLALLGSLLAVRYKHRGMLMLAGIFWFFLLYLAFGSISLSHYTAGSLITRYLDLVAAPMAVLVAYAMVNVAGKFPIRGRGGWVRIAVFVVLLALVLIAMIHTYRLVYYYNEMIRHNPFWYIA